MVTGWPFNPLSTFVAQILFFFHSNCQYSNQYTETFHEKLRIGILLCAQFVYHPGIENPKKPNHWALHFSYLQRTNVVVSRHRLQGNGYGIRVSPCDVRQLVEFFTSCAENCFNLSPQKEFITIIMYCRLSIYHPCRTSSVIFGFWTCIIFWT